MTQTAEKKLASLATTLMYARTGQISTVQFDDLIRHESLEYRKDKTFKDILGAFSKALKNGHQKTEHECTMFALYLGEVLKEAK